MVSMCSWMRENGTNHPLDRPRGVRHFRLHGNAIIQSLSEIRSTADENTKWFGVRRVLKRMEVIERHTLITSRCNLPEEEGQQFLPWDRYVQRLCSSQIRAYWGGR